jgi:hypothetical protein
VLAQVPGPARFLAPAPGGADSDLPNRMPANLPSVSGLADAAGSDSFVTRRYREWEQATREATGGESPWGRKPSPNLRSAAVRYYLLSPRDSSPLPSLGAPAVREDREALAYARLHPNTQRQASKEELLSHLAHPGRVPEVALTLGPDAPAFDGRTTTYPLAARRVNGNRLVIEGEAPAPGLVVVAEQFDPAWRARLNGRAAPVTPADHLLVGVPSPTAGEVRLELFYAPAAFRVGLFLSGLALALWLALWVGAASRPGRGR